MNNKSLMEKLNRFTRREMNEAEVYIFPVTLCDNDIDRDTEMFSDNALEAMKSLFIGVTGIFDHNPTGENQTSRIFETEIVTDSTRLNSVNKPYRYLKGYAYMVRTDNNKALISEIDAGIKKEVSVSCRASAKICSICGCDLTKSHCSHIKGKEYNGELCYTILDSITDAYEWSFVAVPAQKNAGVTKHFSGENTEICEKDKIIAECRNEVCTEILSVAYNISPYLDTILSGVLQKMALSELLCLKKTLKKHISGGCMRISVNNSRQKAKCDCYKTAGVAKWI